MKITTATTHVYQCTVCKVWLTNQAHVGCAWKTQLYSLSKSSPRVKYIFNEALTLVRSYLRIVAAQSFEIINCSKNSFKFLRLGLVRLWHFLAQHLRLRLRPACMVCNYAWYTVCCRRIRRQCRATCCIRARRSSFWSPSRPCTT